MGQENNLNHYDDKNSTLSAIGAAVLEAFYAMGLVQVPIYADWRFPDVDAYCANAICMASCAAQISGFETVKPFVQSAHELISGGENISSVEVEDVLYRHPAVIAAAVVAKPDPKWGETPCAFLEIKPGSQVTAEDIIAHCKQHLAGFKVPRAIVFCELPKTSTGKIQKFELRKQAGSATAIDV